jgi:uncharacterized protein YuzE
MILRDVTEEVLIEAIERPYRTSPGRTPGTLVHDAVVNGRGIRVVVVERTQPLRIVAVWRGEYLVHVEYDSEADALYFTIRQPDGAVETEFVDEARYVDYDEAGNVVGVEILGVSQGVDVTGLPEAAKLAEALNAIPRSKAVV